MKKSSLCLWLAFLVIVGFALVPPWKETYEGTHQKIWYAPINRPPKDAVMPIVDYPRMFTDIAVGESFVLLLYLTLGTKKK